MRTLFDLISDGYELKTCGTNSIILKKGNYVYKITREFSFDDIKDIKVMLDGLKSKNVNVVPILDVESVKFASQTDFNLAISAIMDAKNKNEKLQVPVNQSLQKTDEKNSYVLPMLKFDCIEGQNIFGENRLDGLKLINKNQVFKNAKVLHPAVKEKLMADLAPNLQLAESLTPQEVYKFVQDCKNILNAGLSIDNRTGDNFIYGTDAKGNKGIFFIDLGGIEKMSKGKSLGETNLFFATIDNMCRMLYVDTTADLGDAEEKIADVYEKYDKVLKKTVQDDDVCKEQFAEYMKTDNYYKKLGERFNRFRKERDRE